MTAMKQDWIRVGDWVSGTSLEDEKFIGYVESIDLYGMAKVRVTQCDHDGAVGEVLVASLAKMDKLAEYVPSEEADLRSLLDLALMTRDQAWFEDLYASLRMAQFNLGGKENGPGFDYRSTVSRIKID
ncbi:hypothetical protein N0M98_27105 [Paenibacillus doosanensis]|uniref:IDEAL domain-containing protein n=1 Tax=Paenibacillus konkukensis TaxID=2020716 RepID=A0ABY4RRV1_9BACL|nr:MULTISPECIES: hypothetical protein [Paenibacillus]MCS7463778.1 hypothetical protein [Paenibacillus doosanensis]UQZ85276.1 hypothetical protein SK3146_04565 [Paenibacillus konkukensis]